MLGNIELNVKSYEQIREEAIAQIPIYSRDWTNYNVSDPGITILENLSAFLALQQSEMNEIPEKIKRKLLTLIGLEPAKGRAACAYIALASSDIPILGKIPDRLKLYAQNICFEFENDIVIKHMRIVSVRTRECFDDRFNALLDKNGVKGGMFLMGEKPVCGETVYLFLEDLPDEGREAAIFFEMDEYFPRNRFLNEGNNPFVKVRWEIKSSKGYLAFSVNDGTNGFLQSGYVKFVINKDLSKNIIRTEKENAYVIRITLEKADYDIVPCFKKIGGLLTGVIQKDTRSDIRIRDSIGEKDFIIDNFILSNGYLEIYGLESDGFYHRYYDSGNMYSESRLRSYHVEQGEDIRRKVIFENTVPKRIMTICRDASVMAYRSLGILYGYDEQIIELPRFRQVYAMDFSILVVKRSVEHGDICHVVRPETETQGEVRYSICEEEQVLVIHDCGQYEGAEVRMGTYALYMGSDGNVLPGTEFDLMYDNHELKFVNCAAGEAGHYEETFEQLQKRFVSDIRNPVTMVTQRDCEQIVKRVPGLSIHKIGVCPVPQKNEIHIVVKPYSIDAFPKLTDIYMQEIRNYLEKFRLLTTKIVIEQPVYVPIHVTGLIYIKKHFELCRQRIEGFLRKTLDGIHSDSCFGDKIVFHEIYKNLESIDCIDEICELSIFPDDYRYAAMSGLDIRLSSNALYYSGSFRLELTGR